MSKANCTPSCLSCFGSNGASQAIACNRCTTAANASCTAVSGSGFEDRPWVSGASERRVLSPEARSAPVFTPRSGPGVASKGSSEARSAPVFTPRFGPGVASKGAERINSLARLTSSLSVRTDTSASCITCCCSCWGKRGKSRASALVRRAWASMVRTSAHAFATRPRSEIESEPRRGDSTSASA